ncbi:hypothetical protein NQ315_011925 [Exocentrus adspersus]|uniref:Major facilitator superfamily (MFS) profile domain-containing protein n=1 Tax=Exocentrus adspersus TaxID=1586481 RepID=A0AAV8W1R4_9CUCU|nr:hypothetical protein NQ315_011925 [Exocentrus adspersus]
MRQRNSEYFTYTLLVVFAVDLLATSGDITLSWTSPIYPKLYSNDTSINPFEEPITEDQDAWIGSLVTIGAVIGPLPFGFIAEHLGRKVALLSIAIPHMISYFTLAFAKNVYIYYAARFLGGLAMGGGYTVLPMYIAEVSQDATRGMMSQTLNVFWAIGNFLPYAIGPFISVMYFNIILACIPTTFFVLFLFLAPETPYFLVGKNKLEKAEQALLLLRSGNQEQTRQEFEYIKTHFKGEEDGHFSDIFRNKGLRKAFIVCIVLIIAQELSGFCAITFYLQPIFEAAGTSLSADISALIVGSTIFLSSFILPFVIDSIGRKILTIVSCFGMSAALLMLGAFFFVKDSTDLDADNISWMPIFSLIFFIVSFNMGIGSIPWTLSSELFPSNVKQVSSSALSSACWITSFFVTKFFNDMNHTMKRSGTFWFFSAVCLAAAIFSIIFVPETKGKSFSEIQEMLNPGSQQQKTERKESNLLALTGDTTLTWSSPVLPKLYSNDSNVNPLGRPITTTEESWIGSLQYIGAMCGILPFAVLADRIGRKPVLLALAFPHIISFLTFAFARDIEWYYVGRFLGGVSLSSVYIVLPITFASFGDLFPYITGPYMPLMWFNITLAVFPILFFVLFLLLAPESPYFYVGRGKNNLYDVRGEIDEIKNEISKNQKGDILNTLKKRYVIKGFFIALGLSSVQQLSGLAAILAYTEFIFTAAGSKLAPDVSSIIVGVVLFLASFGGPLIVDRKGAYFYLLDNSSVDLNKVSWLPIVCLMVYMVTFNIGFGPLPYTITSEILPLNVKFFLATITGFSGWLMSFLVSRFFNDLNAALGRGGTFWLFSGFCVAGLLFIIFVVPETKGKSFQEIQGLLDK